MRKICGFILFWLGIGITIGMYLDPGFILICTLVLMIIIGYNLFSSCN